jgi:hypothetical protein
MVRYLKKYKVIRVFDVCSWVVTCRTADVSSGKDVINPELVQLMRIQNIITNRKYAQNVLIHSVLLKRDAVIRAQRRFSVACEELADSVTFLPIFRKAGHLI